MGVKIAIATDDGETVRFGHFGGAEYFYIYKLENEPLLLEKRKNLVKDMEEEHNSPGKARKVLKLLEDCDILIAHSMGLKSREFLEKNNKKPYLLKKKNVKIEEAIEEALRELKYEI